MECNATMMEGEGGEWNSFDGVSVNEEANFMAQLFPNCLLNNELESSSMALSSSCYSGMTGDDSASFFCPDDIDINLYCHSGNYYLSDAQQYLAANSSRFPVDLLPSVAKNCIQRFPCNPVERNDRLDLEISCGGSFEDHTEFSEKNVQLKQEYEMSEIDRSSDLAENGRKRSRVSQNGKRNMRTKKNRKNHSDDEDSAPEMNRQNCSSSEEECNESQELSGVASSSLSSKETSTVNVNGKTRASRGAATDPQSLYARKRRERINERLKILQNLVPNGTKVDISTMLEEAVQYVKFLQHQIKLLSSDELWMYAPLAYNGVEIGLNSKIEALL